MPAARIAGPLADGEPERAEALRQLAQEIAARCQEGKREALGPGELPALAPIDPAHQWRLAWYPIKFESPESVLAHAY